MVQHPKLKKVKLKRWQLRKTIFEIVILGLLSGGGSWRRPTLPLLVKAVIEYFKEEKKLAIEEVKVKRALEDFEAKDIFSFREKDDDVYVTLNEKNPTVIKYSLRSILDFKIKEKKFAGKWYMVFFDVPEIQKNKRDQLRYLLEKLGFFRYQKSVYILPYECWEEVKLVKKIVEGGKYMKYIVVDKIEDAEKVKRHFQLIN